MNDQAEQLRRRLEALGSKPMPDPSLDDRATLPSAFQPVAPARPDRAPIEETARKRKLEAAIEDANRARPAVIVGVRIGFFPLVALMVKVALASVPATLIVSAIVWFFLVMLHANR